MPIYEYQCPDCSGEFELMQKVGAEAPPCPKCGGTKTARMLSRTSFVLKGGGWYKDGYASTSNQKSSSSSSSAPSSAPAPAAAAPASSTSSD